MSFLKKFKNKRFRNNSFKSNNFRSSSFGSSGFNSKNKGFKTILLKIRDSKYMQE